MNRFDADFDDYGEHDEGEKWLQWWVHDGNKKGLHPIGWSPFSPETRLVDMWLVSCYKCKGVSAELSKAKGLDLYVTRVDTVIYAF